MSIEFIDEAGFDVDPQPFMECTRHVLKAMHLHPETDVAITLVDEAAMEQMHIDWMDLPGPTDVMSFPLDELRPGTPSSVTGVGVLGDVVICPPVAQKQAEARGHSARDEMLLLLTHSLLHLMGYDHGTEETKQEMFALQDRLLTAYLGYPAPEATTE